MGGGWFPQDTTRKAWKLSSLHCCTPWLISTLHSVLRSPILLLIGKLCLSLFWETQQPGLQVNRALQQLMKKCCRLTCGEHRSWLTSRTKIQSQGTCYLSLDPRFIWYRCSVESYLQVPYPKGCHACVAITLNIQMGRSSGCPFKSVGLGRPKEKAFP